MKLVLDKEIAVKLDETIEKLQLEFKKEFIFESDMKPILDYMAELDYDLRDKLRMDKFLWEPEVRHPRFSGGYPLTTQKAKDFLAKGGYKKIYRKAVSDNRWLWIERYGVIIAALTGILALVKC